MNTLTPLIAPGFVFVLTLASGFWLSNTGRPLNTALFTVHKLIALGAVVATGFQLFGALRGAQLQALVVALLVVAGLSVVALFATGALMSLNNAGYAVWHTIHRVAPVLLVIALALAVYLIIGRPL
jgi:hypothetical protein